MRFKPLARRLYMDTRGMPSFSSNDLRTYNLHTLVKSVGAFFRWLQEEGYAMRIGEERASHDESHGRRIGKWIWTVKAQALFANET